LSRGGGGQGYQELLAYAGGLMTTAFISYGPETIGARGAQPGPAAAGLRLERKEFPASAAVGRGVDDYSAAP